MSSDLQHNWANLPSELLEFISKSLDSHIDFVRFRAVCQSWRSSNSTFHLQQSASFSRFVPFTICCFQFEGAISSSCLVKVFELESGEFLIANPLSNFFKIKGKRTDMTLDMLKFRLIELYKSWDYKFLMLDNGDHCKKVIFCGGDCNSLRISVNGKLGFQRIRGGNWESCGSFEVHYDDIVVYQGQYYVIDNVGIVYWVDNNSMNVVQYYPPLNVGGQLKNLIESDGRLYVVDSYLDSDRWRRPAWQDGEIDRVDRECMRIDMKVYLFDEELGSWMNVGSLGNRVFVLGRECSFSFSARGLPGWEGNCIYFMECPAGDHRKDLKYNVLWVFRLDDRSVRRVSFLPSQMTLFSPSMFLRLCSCK